MVYWGLHTRVLLQMSTVWRMLQLFNAAGIVAKKKKLTFQVEAN